MENRASKAGEWFTPSEVAVLKSELAEHELDCWQAGELIELFLRGHGFGVSHQAARALAARFDASLPLEAIAKELESVALVM